MSEEIAVRRPVRAPTHPGAILREDVIPALRMSVTEAAEHLHITRQTLHRILAEKAGVSPEMAVRLGKFCGNGPGLWLRLQVAYDLWHAQKALASEIATIPTFRDAA
jgi:addiction module HigA family antidote